MVGVFCELAVATSERTPTIPYDKAKHSLAVMSAVSIADWRVAEFLRSVDRLGEVSESLDDFRYGLILNL